MASDLPNEQLVETQEKPLNEDFPGYVQKHNNSKTKEYAIFKN
jgi:hypothetical protein